MLLFFVAADFVDLIVAGVVVGAVFVDGVSIFVVLLALFPLLLFPFLLLYCSLLFDLQRFVASAHTRPIQKRRIAGKQVSR